jgi:predicted small lipoprotein YifL
MKTLALLLAVSLLLSACGQAGDLYLPDKPAAEQKKDEQQKQQQPEP